MNPSAKHNLSSYFQHHEADAKVIFYYIDKAKKYVTKANIKVTIIISPTRTAIL